MGKGGGGGGARAARTVVEVEYEGVAEGAALVGDVARDLEHDRDADAVVGGARRAENGVHVGGNEDSVVGVRTVEAQDEVGGVHGGMESVVAAAARRVAVVDVEAGSQLDIDLDLRHSLRCHELELQQLLNERGPDNCVCCRVERPGGGRDVAQRAPHPLTGELCLRAGICDLWERESEREQHAEPSDEGEEHTRANLGHAAAVAVPRCLPPMQQCIQVPSVGVSVNTNHGTKYAFSSGIFKR